MYIPNSAFTFINIAIIIVCLLNIVLGYKKGLVYQLLTLLSFFGAFLVAYLLTPIFSSHIVLVHATDSIIDLVTSQLLNYFIWFVLILIATKLVLSVVIQFSKILSHIPLIGFANKVAGAAFGLVNTAIWVIIFSALLLTPVFKNGQEIRENTYIKPFNDATNQIVLFLSEKIDLNALNIDPEVMNVDELRQNIEVWLVEQGVLEEGAK